MDQMLKSFAVVFFCSVGLIYSGSAIGAEESASGPGATGGTGGTGVELTAPATAPAPEVNPTPSAEQPPAAEQTPAVEQPPVAEQTPDTEQSPVQAEVGGEQLPAGQTVHVGTFGQIDLHVKDLNVTKVLQLLSIQAQRNIIATKNVSGSVSADLYQVDFYDALDAILHANGYGYVEKDSFIYVYTVDELEKIKLAEQKPVVRVYSLNYLTAKDASAFTSPLLSAAGSISVSGDVSAGFQPTVSNGGENTNAYGEILVIQDYADNVDQIVGVLKELDVRPKQVQVAATILEARLTENNAFGVDIAAVVDFDFAKFADPTGVVDDLISGDGPERNDRGEAIQTTVGQTGSGPSGIKFGILSSNISVFIKALDAVTDTTVIAKPTILALNRQSADLLVGEKLGYLSTTATETSQTQTVEFLEVGTQLSFRAFISDDDFVRLELRPSVSDGSTTVVEGLVIPNETTNELVTNVMVRSGQTVVIGGLFKEDTTRARRQVPYLGDVPVVGAAFKGRDDTIERSEVIFLITPTVMKDEAMYAEGERAGESIEMAQVGAKQGLLPWARTKQTAGYMRDAIAAHRDGQDEKALWNVNMALTLDPMYVQALRLKSELTGQKLFLPDRSLLRDAADQIVNEQVDAVEPPQSGVSEPPNAVDIDVVAPEAAPSDVNTEESADLSVEQPVDGNSQTQTAAPAQIQAADESVGVENVLSSWWTSTQRDPQTDSQSSDDAASTPADGSTENQTDGQPDTP